MLQPVTKPQSPNGRIGVLAFFLLQNFTNTRKLLAFPQAIAQSPIKPEQCNLTRFVVENFLKSVEKFREDCGKVVESLGKNSPKDKNFEDGSRLTVQPGIGFSGMDHGLILLMRSPITLYPSFAVLVHLSI